MKHSLTNHISQSETHSEIIQSTKLLYRDRISETGQKVLDLLSISSEDLSEKQLLDFLSLQKNITIENGEILVKGKKKQRKKLDAEKFFSKK